MNRRAILKDLACEATTHAGLWLDRYLRDHETGSKQDHFDQTVDKIEVPSQYRRFFERWKAMLRGHPCTLLGQASTQGRLIVGLGSEAVLEASVTLHHTYGVPYLPGTALKGLAASFADRQLEDPRWRKQPLGESHRTLFGDPDGSGCVTFHDALWIPQGKSLPLDPDVLTVHHPDYYGGTGDLPPADWDSPKPVPFVSSRGDFLLALTGPPAWAKVAWDLLSLALNEEGLGGKTAAGYGRCKVKQEAVIRGPHWKERIKGLNLSFASKLVVEVLESLAGDPAERQLAARSMLELLGGKKSLKSHKEKDWVKSLFTASE